MAVIGGEPGIGKTRLAARFAGIVETRGAQVLYGRSDPELSLPLQAFAEAFAELAAASDSGEALQLEGSSPPLARIVPEIRRRLEADVSASAEIGGQHELLAVASELLSLASRHAPLLVIVDDIHCADRATAQMLRYLRGTTDPLRAMLMVTYRTTEMDLESTIARTLMELERSPDVVDLLLGGLARQDSLALAATVAGHDLSTHEVSVAGAVHDEADGNPLFCTQLLQNLGEAGAGQVADQLMLRDEVTPINLPDSVATTLLTRVDRLGGDSVSALTTAAVIGPRFGPAHVQQLSGQEMDRVCAAFDIAQGAGIISRTSAKGSYEFTHSLFRRALYQRVGPAQRGRIHRRIAELMEEAQPNWGAHRASELARHWLEAIPADRQHAGLWSKRAAEAALEQFESDTAVHWFKQALRLIDGRDSRERCELSVGLGIAQRRSGEPEFRETLLAAARLSAELGEVDLLVAAALANNRGFASASGTVDQERIAILELALQETEVAVDGDRAALLATLAAELSFSGDRERRVELSDEALRIARQLGDPKNLCRVLTARFVPIWIPETLPERLANSGESVALANQVGHPQEQFEAIHWHSVALVQSGRIAEAIEAIERESEIAGKLGDPTATWISTYDRGNLALIAGRLDEAEILANEALAIAGESGQPDGLSFFGSQIANVRYEQGRLPELLELLAQVVTDNPGLPAFRAVLALAYAESDLDEEARRLLMLAAESDFEELPEDVTWLAGHTIYAHVCARVAEQRPARLLYERLAPFAGHIVYTGISAWGDCDHALGVLATTLGDLALGERHLQESRARARRMGAAVWSVRSSIDLAALLLRRGTADDSPRAVELLEAAADDARRLGVDKLATRALNLRSHAHAQGLIRASDGAAAKLRLRSDESHLPEKPSRRQGLLRFEGESWSVTHPGGTIRLRDGKGPRYLATLLADPGVEQHAVDLQSGPAPGSPATSDSGASAAGLSIRAAGDGDAGAVLDEQAKRAYRRRIEDLREEIEEAESFNDPDRASRAREELEFVGRELASAVGIGGRDRLAASSAERARVNVTRAIRKTVIRIAELDAELGAHLRGTIRTGAFCVYEPSAGDRIDWEIAQSPPP